MSTTHTTKTTPAPTVERHVLFCEAVGCHGECLAAERADYSRFTAINPDGRTVRAWDTTEAKARDYILLIQTYEPLRLIDASGRTIMSTEDADR